MIAAAILILAVTGILIAYLHAMELTEIARNMSICTRAAVSRMERIQSTAFGQLVATYHNAAFDVTGLDVPVNAKGVSYVTAVNADIVEVVVSVSWQQKNDRVFGEDANLNGALNGGEDANGNGILDSPVKLVTRIYNR